MLGFVGPFMLMAVAKISLFFGIVYVDLRKVVWDIYVIALLMFYFFIIMKVVAFRKKKTIPDNSKG